jgi:hypothetical protein
LKRLPEVEGCLKSGGFSGRPWGSDAASALNAGVPRANGGVAMKIQPAALIPACYQPRHTMTRLHAQKR